MPADRRQVSVSPSKTSKHLFRPLDARCGPGGTTDRQPAFEPSAAPVDRWRCAGPAGGGGRTAPWRPPLVGAARAEARVTLPLDKLLLLSANSVPITLEKGV